MTITPDELSQLSEKELLVLQEAQSAIDEEIRLQWTPGGRAEIGNNLIAEVLKQNPRVLAALKESYSVYWNVSEYKDGRGYTWLAFSERSFELSPESIGATGAPGQTGAAGPTGPQGATGMQGTTGLAGNIGPTGIQGATGTQGVAGLDGAQGSQGVTGMAGIQGAQGLRGDTGIQGTQGFQGNTGLLGNTGLQGVQGNTGAQGATGPAAPPDSLSTIAYAASVSLDFSSGLSNYRTISLAGNLAITTVNLAAARTISLRIICDSLTRSITVPSGWTFLGSSFPGSIQANKTAILSLTAFGISDSDVIAAYASQP